MFNPRNGIIIPTDNHIFYREVAEATTNDRQPKPLCLLCSARSLRWAPRMARNSENAHQCLACAMGGNPTESSWISVWKAKRTMGFLLFHIIYYNNYNHVYEWHYYHSWGAIHVLKMFFVFLHLFAWCSNMEGSGSFNGLDLLTTHDFPSEFRLPTVYSFCVVVCWVLIEA